MMPTLKALLGRNVKARRKQLKLSQAALGARVDLSEGTIGLLEQGKVWPEYENLLNIAAALGVDDRYLFSVGPQAPADPPPEKALEVLTEFVKKHQKQGV